MIIGKCSIFYHFIEKFKQVEFSKKKVYSILQLIVRGYTNKGKRNYNKISSELAKKLQIMQNE